MSITIVRLLNRFFKKVMSIHDFETEIKLKIQNLEKSYNDIKEISFSSVNNYSELVVTIWLFNQQSIEMVISYDKKKMNLKKVATYKMDMEYDISNIQSKMDIEVKGILSTLEPIFKLYLQRQGKSFI